MSLCYHYMYPDSMRTKIYSINVIFKILLLFEFEILVPSKTFVSFFGTADDD